MLQNLSEAELSVFNSKLKLPSLERLRELFNYDADTGLLIRKKYSGPKHIGRKYFAGQVIGKEHQPRKRVYIDGTLYHCHRLIWKIHKGRDPEGDVDHRDRNSANDRIENLKDGSRSQNMHNTSIRKDNKTGYKGILIHTYTKLYFARIRVRGKTYCSKYTADMQEAVKMRDALRTKHLGEYYGE